MQYNISLSNVVMEGLLSGPIRHSSRCPKGQKPLWTSSTKCIPTTKWHTLTIKRPMSMHRGPISHNPSMDWLLNSRTTQVKYLKMYLKSCGVVSLPLLVFPAGRPPWPLGCGSNKPQDAGHHTLDQTGKMLPSGAHGPDPAGLGSGSTVFLHFFFKNKHWTGRLKIQTGLL